VLSEQTHLALAHVTTRLYASWSWRSCVSRRPAQRRGPVIQARHRQLPRDRSTRV